MANTDLLKEAIADAKAVKETAIANAKLALEEAFTPHLQDMLSKKLAEMDLDEDVNESKEEAKEKLNQLYSDDDLADGLDYLSDYDEPLNSPEDIDIFMASFKEDYIIDESKEKTEEINLDELLAELELDENARTDAEEEGYKDGIKDEKADLKEDDVTDAEEEGYLDGEEDEKEDEDDKSEDEEIDLEDMSEDDLKGFIEDVIKDLVTDGTIEAGEEFAGEEEDIEDIEDVVDVEDVEDVDVEVEIDEMTNKEKAEGDDRKKDDKVEAETEKMRFKEALDEINALKVEVSEVNLLNAKLLYTNKIFKEKNLSEGKKVKVLKAFDKATTVKEAKVIFETLNEGITSSRSTPMVNEIKGRASKATGIISEAKKPIIESNEVYNRMRKLAGLI